MVRETIDIQNPALNTIAHLMVNIPFENKLTTITFFGKQCSMVQLEEKCCKGFLFSACSIVSDSRKAYLLDKILFVHNIHAVKFSKLSMQVEVSSNRYHLLWGSLISFHMKRIHIKLTRYQRKIDNIFHKRNIQFNLMGNIKL